MKTSATSGIQSEEEMNPWGSLGKVELDTPIISEKHVQGDNSSIYSHMPETVRNVIIDGEFTSTVKQGLQKGDHIKSPIEGAAPPTMKIVLKEGAIPVYNMCVRNIPRVRG